MTIKVVDGDGMYDVYVDDYCEGTFFTRQGAVKFAKKLAREPKRKHEWLITKDSKDEISRSGPKWWHWGLIILFALIVCIVSMGI